MEGLTQYHAELFVQKLFEILGRKNNGKFVFEKKDSQVSQTLTEKSD